MTLSRSHVTTHALIASYGCEKRERGLQCPWGREDPAPHSLHSAPSCLWLTGAGEEVMTGSAFLTLVVVGSDDLGLLRMLLVCQISYLRKTEGPAVTTGTTVEFSPGQSGELCVSTRKAGWGWGAVHPRLGLNTCPPICTAPRREYTGTSSHTPERRSKGWAALCIHTPTAQQVPTQILFCTSTSSFF